MSSERIDRIRRLCATWVEEDVHKALVVLVSRRGVVCLHEAFGRLGPETDARVERDSIFPLMSLTKPITATALMMLVEDGLVGLTRPVQEYVPEFCGTDKELVCVHHLLTHTSGVTDELVGARTADRRRSARLPDPDPTQDPFVHKVLLLGADAPLSTKPGELMVYATYNYALIGEIIRRASGCSLAAFAAARIFEPLGIVDTSYVLPEELFVRTVSWQAAPRSISGVDSASPGFRRTPHADGGVHATAIDTAVFGQAFLNGGSYGDTRILSPNMVSEMTRNQVPGVRAPNPAGILVDASWGYGWCIGGFERWPGWPSFAPGSYSHSGAGSMMLWVDPAREIVGVYLTVCRRKPNGDPLNNVDLFVNAINASIED